MAASWISSPKRLGVWYSGGPSYFKNGVAHIMNECHHLYITGINWGYLPVTRNLPWLKMSKLHQITLLHLYKVWFGWIYPFWVPVLGWGWAVKVPLVTDLAGVVPPLWRLLWTDDLHGQKRFARCWLAGWLAEVPTKSLPSFFSWSLDDFKNDFRCCLLTFVRSLLIFLNELSCSCERTGIP